MQVRTITLSSAAAIVAAVTFIGTASPSLAGGFGRGNRMGGHQGFNRGFGLNHSLANGANRQRRGADDPANHNAGDDRGRRADDPANHDAADDRGANQPGDDRGRHHGRGRH
jgi:hypothetical protein